MSPTARPDVVARIRAQLVGQAGGYLRNVVRDPGSTCSVCCTPVQGFPRCLPCNNQRRQYGSRLADLVIPLTYAVGRAQSSLVVRLYKNHPNDDVRARFSSVVSQLLFLGLVLHERCIETAVGASVTSRMTVPSLSGRRGTHPLERIAQAMGATHPGHRIDAVPGVSNDREVAESRFTVISDDGVAGAHVLLIDDTWTTGSRAQSAVLSLRAAGATYVTILTISRWLEPSFRGTEEFIRSRLRTDYDPDRCPVTGDRCPTSL